MSGGHLCFPCLALSADLSEAKANMRRFESFIPDQSKDPSEDGFFDWYDSRTVLRSRGSTPTKSRAEACFEHDAVREL